MGTAKDTQVAQLSGVRKGEPRVMGAIPEYLLGTVIKTKSNKERNLIIYHLLPSLL